MPISERRLTPHKIVRELDNYIVGQAKAKRTVALALRWRWRRMRVEPETLRNEIIPKNILMIGHTGVGKTEISRRLAKLINAPFIKVEATKFTEVGYVGRDVDSIIRDLVEKAVETVREECAERVREKAERHAEERVLDALLPETENSETTRATREKLRQQLHEGKLYEREIEIDVSATPQVEVFSPPGMEEITQQMNQMFQHMNRDKRRKRQMTVLDALNSCADEEVQNLLDINEIKDIAIDRVEQSGIVFIDEIDKIADSDKRGADVSRHGVQRDLLPLVEGTTVSTRYGSVHTHHILFIASGAFHYNRPSDLIPELQGRFPLRVMLDALTVDDFKAILTGTKACLIRQYCALMKTEKVILEFTDDAIDEIAITAFRVNESSENTGARRLYAILEHLLEEDAFNAEQKRGQTIVIDAKVVKERLKDAVGNTERTRYIL